MLNMAHEDNCSLKSSIFGDEYQPEDLSYDELGDDCQYLILREADPIKFKDKKIPKIRGTLNSLKDLENERKKLMRALKEKPLPSEEKDIEIIDLTLNSDEENETMALASGAQTTQIQESKTPPIEQIQVPKQQRPLKQTSTNKPLGKKISKRCEVSNYFVQDSDATEETCNHCKHTRRRKLKKIQREERETNSSDSYAPQHKHRRKREKIREAVDRRVKRYSESPAKYLDNKPSKKAFHDVEEAFGDFRCRVCNIEVHSEVTLQTHLVGRRHLRNLMAQAIPEVAKQSLEQFSSKPSSFVSYQDENQLLHYPLSAAGMTRIRVNKRAKLQTIAESYRKHPVMGLTYVTEIHLLKEVVYYCELCDSSCAPNTIMIHLVGFKHKLNFFKITYPIMYERFEYQPKRVIEQEMMKILIDHDRTRGRGLIKVEEEVDEIRVRKRRRSHSPHRATCLCTSCRSEVRVFGYNHKRKNRADSLVTDDLDTSMNDFHCTVCDSHMNNEQMWEAHVRGRRHLKNKKKGPSEKISNMKNIHCPGERPKLLNELLDIREPIVGLNYIQEVQGRAGNQYKCFLCGAGCTNFDIIEHILSEKHRMKLLEVENKKGKPNDIETIFNLSLGLSLSAREKLVEQEASKFQREYGRGRMVVYKSKDIFPDF